MRKDNSRDDPDYPSSKLIDKQCRDDLGCAKCKYYKGLNCALVAREGQSVEQLSCLTHVVLGVRKAQDESRKRRKRGMTLKYEHRKCGKTH
ncbi:hypothetical protein CDL15_Pgr017507 [Punica granatum]|uniref:Uncharacterized protein n=1 Tax=Punica granatum TaxID=22663 RepID=A0A218WTZ7_PUNGR|nr:hypothetical protein CDL15_Pgr017507 [Punica granatum]